MATKKAQTLARELANRLSIRFAAAATPLIVTSTVDASGNPVITVGDATPSTGEQYLFIRVVGSPDPIGVNSVGQAQPSYGPHAVQVLLETSATSGVAFLTEANNLVAMGEILRLGHRTEVYMRATGTLPAVADITAANLVGFFDDLYFPMLSGG